MNTESIETMDAASPQATKPDRKPRTKIPHERSKFVHATNRYRRELGADFDAPDLLRVAEMSDDEYVAVHEGVIRAISNVLGGVAQPAPAQDVDAQMAGLAHWFRQRPVIFHRTDEQMAAIRRKLVETGGELVPLYALSVGIKLPKTGKLIFVNNQGEECQP